MTDKEKELAAAKAAEEAAQKSADEAKAAEVKAAEEAKAAEDKAKAEADAKAAEEAKAKEEAEAKEKAEAEAKAVEEAKAAEEKAAAEAAAKAESDKAEAAKNDKKAAFKKAMCSEDLDLIKEDLTESELALASKYSFVELVKLNASLALEVGQARAEKETAEAAKKAEARVQELATAGLLFLGEKAEAQKKEVAVMTDEVFAGYKTTLASLKESIEAEEPIDKSEIEKARASAGNLAVVTKDESGSLIDKMAQI